MGCPAKKVCNVLAGSALLQNEPLVARILEAVVKAIPHTPVTLKMRTGWNADHKNALRILRIAEDAGVQALAIHGRTRCQQYRGEAEYDTIAAVKRMAKLPVIANGDIDTPQKAAEVLAKTGADGLMIGRAAQGRPWIFREIEHYLSTGETLPPPSASEIHRILQEHLEALYSFYGKEAGCRVARKHIAWYTRGLSGSASFRHHMNQLAGVEEQSLAVDQFFGRFSWTHAEPLKADKNGEDLIMHSASHMPLTPAAAPIEGRAI